MKHLIAATLITLALIQGEAIGMAARPPHHVSGTTLCQGRWFSQINQQQPERVLRRHVLATISCAFGHMGLRSSVPTAIEIARRESGWNPWAVNHSSNALGLFQHLSRYWPARAAALPRWMSRSAFNPLANSVAAARMVRADGSWRAWSTA